MALRRHPSDYVAVDELKSAAQPWANESMYPGAGASAVNYQANYCAFNSMKTLKDKHLVTKLGKAPVTYALTETGAALAQRLDEAYQAGEAEKQSGSGAAAAAAAPTPSPAGGRLGDGVPPHAESPGDAAHAPAAAFDQPHAPNPYTSRKRQRASAGSGGGSGSPPPPPPLAAAGPPPPPPRLAGSGAASAAAAAAAPFAGGAYQPSKQLSARQRTSFEASLQGLQGTIADHFDLCLIVDNMEKLSGAATFEVRLRRRGVVTGAWRVVTSRAGRRRVTTPPTHPTPPHTPRQAMFRAQMEHLTAERKIPPSHRLDVYRTKLVLGDYVWVLRPRATAGGDAAAGDDPMRRWIVLDGLVERKTANDHNSSMVRPSPR